jgi:hypothetical protein
MAATGAELMAFFTHYDTITAPLKKKETALRVAAMRWLINNMSWHIARLRPSVVRAYGQRAMKPLQAFDQKLWDSEIMVEFAQVDVGDYLTLLRAGDMAAFLTLANLKALTRQLGAVERRLGQQDKVLKQTQDRLEVIGNIQEYQALIAKS